LTAAGQVFTSKPWARSTLWFLVLDEANSNSFKWNDFFTFMLGICRMMLLGCVFISCRQSWQLQIVTTAFWR
jgi:hypothetical protein